MKQSDTMKLLPILFLSLVCFQGIKAQSFELKNNIEIMVGLNGQQSLVHTVEVKQTLYNISRLYNIPIKELLTYNKLSNSDIIYQGNKIYIPLNHKIYPTKIEPNNKYTTIKPVVYTIRAKDSFYAISHRYFNVAEDILMQNNGLKSKDLNIGQHLTIGWISLQENYSEWKDKKSNEVRTTTQKTETTITKIVTESNEDKPLITNTKSSNEQKDVQNTDTTKENLSNEINKHIVNEEINDPSNTHNESNNQYQEEENKELNEFVNEADENIESIIPEKKYLNESGIAMWNKNSSDKANSFVLHPTAKINSVIELYNPLTNRTAYAKVIAHIPDNTYEANIAILISPKVAERLGALDEQFKIRMKYYQ